MKRAREDDDDYVDPSEVVAATRAKKQKIERATRNAWAKTDEDDEDYEEVEDGGVLGQKAHLYVDPNVYIDHRSTIPKGLQAHAEHVLVRPIGSLVALWFKDQIDSKWEALKPGRAESLNEGDVGYTWHHTDLFSDGECYLQLVHTRIHRKISHIGGVAIPKAARRKL